MQCLLLSSWGRPAPSCQYIHVVLKIRNWRAVFGEGWKPLQTPPGPYLFRVGRRNKGWSVDSWVITGLERLKSSCKPTEEQKQSHPSTIIMNNNKTWTIWNAAVIAGVGWLGKRTWLGLFYILEPVFISRILDITLSIFISHNDSLVRAHLH